MESVVNPLEDPSLELIKTPYSATYAGINGPPLECGERWEAPIFMGAGTGTSNYKASVVENSDLPSLLCLNSVRDKEAVIHSGHDALYVPEIPEEGIYRKIPLGYDGVHYVIPTNRVDVENEDEQFYQMQYEVMNEYPDGGARVWMSWQAVDRPASIPQRKPQVQKDLEELDKPHPDQVPGERPRLPPGLGPEEDEQSEKGSYSNTKLRKKVARVVDEYATQLLTGRPAPPMNPSEKVLLQERANRWESKRPSGSPPVLTKDQREADRWDAWNWWDDSGVQTRELTSIGLRTGPEISWSSGWDSGRSEHQKLMLEYQVKYKPRIIIFWPNTRFWKVLQDGSLKLGEDESLNLMVDIIANQVKAGNFFLVRAPWRTGFWKCDQWQKVLRLLPEHYEEDLNPVSYTHLTLPTKA